MGVHMMKKIATMDHTLNENHLKVEIRKSSRAIIIQNDLVLMIHSLKNGDYKFPGGGRKIFESALVNLARETKEETGYDIISSSVRTFGYIEEFFESNNTKNGLFKMISEYYTCKINNKLDKPRLDPYEKAQGYQPVFVSPVYALRKNEGLDSKRYHWIERENLILKILIRMMGDKYEGVNLLQS